MKKVNRYNRLPKAFDKDNEKPLIKILGRSRNPFYKRGSWSPKAILPFPERANTKFITIEISK